MKEKIIKILTKVLKAVLWLVIIAILLAPLYFIMRISDQEASRFTVQEIPTLQETSYGPPLATYRTTIAESVALSGEFVSETYAEMPLSYDKPNLIHWYVANNAEIHEGDVLGTYQGEEIVSTLDGVIVSISASAKDNSYIRVRLPEPLLFKTNCTTTALDSLNLAVKLTVSNEDVEIVRTSFQRNADGTITTLLRVPTAKRRLGEKANITVYTGLSLKNVLVINKDCVYKKNNGKYYMREVTKDGYYLREVEVQIGREGYNNAICVSGVEEGSYFDSGYGFVIGGNLE